MTARPKLPPIHFLIENHWGSAQLRGVQISDALRDRGIEAHCTTELPDLRNSIVVFVKFLDLDLAKALRRNSNLVVLDLIDPHKPYLYGDRQRFLFSAKKRVTTHILGVEAGLFDGIIHVNSWTQEQFGVPGVLQRVIPHHWDPRCTPDPRRRDEFSLVWMGESGYPFMPAEVQQFRTRDHARIGEVFTKASMFTCHFSVRDETGRLDLEAGGNIRHRFYCKSNIKISIAAAFAANISLSKDPAALDILGADYPYYSTTDSMAEVIARARQDYGGRIWNEGLQRMRLVKERTSIERVATDYEDFFKDLRETRY